MCDSYQRFWRSKPRGFLHDLEFSGAVEPLWQIVVNSCKVYYFQKLSCSTIRLQVKRHLRPNSLLKRFLWRKHKSVTSGREQRAEERHWWKYLTHFGWNPLAVSRRTTNTTNFTFSTFDFFATRPLDRSDWASEELRTLARSKSGRTRPWSRRRPLVSQGPW